MAADDPEDVRAAEERGNKLLGRFNDAIAADLELSSGEIYLAAVEVLRNTVFNIRCRGCRKEARKLIDEMVSVRLRDVMVAAAKRDATEPSSKPHLH